MECHNQTQETIHFTPGNAMSAYKIATSVARFVERNIRAKLQNQ